MFLLQCTLQQCSLTSLNLKAPITPLTNKCRLFYFDCQVMTNNTRIQVCAWHLIYNLLKLCYTSPGLHYGWQFWQSDNQQLNFVKIQLLCHLSSFFSQTTEQKVVSLTAFNITIEYNVLFTFRFLHLDRICQHIVVITVTHRLLGFSDHLSF